MDNTYTLKTGVTGAFDPRILPYAQMIGAAFYSLFCRKMVITSIRDGVHMKNSYHYKGLAFDVRIWGLSMHQIDYFINFCKYNFKHCMDIVKEKDHIHFELELNKYSF